MYVWVNGSFWYHLVFSSFYQAQSFHFTLKFLQVFRIVAFKNIESCQKASFISFLILFLFISVWFKFCAEANVVQAVSIRLILLKGLALALLMIIYISLPVVLIFKFSHFFFISQFRAALICHHILNFLLLDQILYS